MGFYQSNHFPFGTSEFRYLSSIFKISVCLFRMKKRPQYAIHALYRAFFLLYRQADQYTLVIFLLIMSSFLCYCSQANHFSSLWGTLNRCCHQISILERWISFVHVIVIMRFDYGISSNVLACISLRSDSEPCISQNF